MQQLEFNDVINKLKELGDSHVDIKTNYKWNFKEFDGNVRDNTNFTLMTYEAPELVPSNTESNLLLNYMCAFNILGMDGVDTSDVTDEVAQNLVLNHTLNIAIEVARKIVEYSAIPFLPNNVKNPWYSILNKLSFSFTKVGPVTTNYLYGYRCEFTLNPKFILTVDESKWNSI